MPPVICALDIIPLFNIAFQEAFNQIESNRKAIAERGWFPLNRVLLDDDVLVSRMVPNDHKRDREEPWGLPCTASQTNTNSPLQRTANPTMQGIVNPPPQGTTVSLNLSEGFASTCIGRLIREADATKHRSELKEKKRKQDEIDKKKGTLRK